jgi:hypothetical protein
MYHMNGLLKHYHLILQLLVSLHATCHGHGSIYSIIKDNGVYALGPRESNVVMRDFSPPYVSMKDKTEYRNMPLVDLMVNRTIFDYCDLESYTRIKWLHARFHVLYNMTETNDWFALMDFDEALSSCEESSSLFILFSLFFNEIVWPSIEQMGAKGIIYLVCTYY